MIKSQKYYRESLFMTIIYLVGTIGFMSSYSELFISLTPINLLMTLGLMLWVNKKEINRALVLVMTFVALITFLIEMLGVNTGVIFGEYKYDTALGFEILGTPPLIGVNWLILSWASVGVVQFVQNRYILSLAATLLMLGLDYIIEPVAPKVLFWSWESGVPPVQNFVAWGIIAYCCCLLLSTFSKKQNVFFAITVIVLQYVFFLSLYLFL